MTDANRDTKGSTQVSELFVIEFDYRSDDGERLVGPFTSPEGAQEYLEALAADDWDATYSIVSLASTIEAAEATEDEEIPVDEPEDDEELITEIPVHGVATLEGRPTGDGRGFRPGAISFGRLPAPLGYEFESSHGGDNSRVAIIGRIDEFWTVPLPDEQDVYEVRWRGVIMTGYERSAEAIEHIVDGSYRGLSVIVDEVEVDVTERRDEMRQRILADQDSAEGDAEASQKMSPEDIEAMIDLVIGDGKQEVTWFTAARVRRFDMVPTGAYQEGDIWLGSEFEDEMSPDRIEAAALALEDCGCGEVHTVYGLQETAIIDLTELDDAELDAYHALEGDAQLEWARERDLILASAYRKVSAEERDRLAKEGKALPDGSFPIANVGDLRNAIQAIGRAADPAKAKAHIKKRARDLGKEDLIPDDWASKLEEAAFAPGTRDGPGWITHPIPTARIRRYWVRGKGAAKIRWGLPGDFNRCRRQLAKYVQNPEWLAGLCANMHKEALGIWPGQHRGKRGHSITASAGPLFVVAAIDPVPLDYFRNPGLTEPTGITVVDDHIYGHIAVWNVCHAGEPEGPGSCTLAPRSSTNYAHFRTGTVVTDEGPIAVGSLTMNTGHAGGLDGPRAAAAHYDNTGTVLADIACGEDAVGIWFSGRIRPTATDDDIYAAQASGRVSGDWRRVGSSYELVGALIVNVPGYGFANSSLAASLVASAGVGVSAIVGEGVVEPDESVKPVETIPFTRDDIDDLVGETVLKTLQSVEQKRIAAAVAPARAALTARNLAGARARLGEIGARR